jgi:hypothetical protein
MGGEDAFGAQAGKCFILVAVNGDKTHERNVDIDLAKWRVPKLYSILDETRALNEIAPDGQYGTILTDNEYSNGRLRLGLAPLGFRVLMEQEKDG